MSSTLKKIFYTLATVFTLILTNYLSGIFAVFQYNLKPWAEGIDITPYQFSHYFKALMVGQIPAENQFNAFQMHGLGFIYALLLVLFLYLIIYLVFASLKNQGSSTSNNKKLLGDAKFAGLGDIKAQKLIKPSEKNLRFYSVYLAKNF